MNVRSAVAALAALGLWATTSSAQDQDLGAKVFRLGNLSAQPADDDNDDDTLLVAARGGHGGHGGHGHGGHGHVGHGHVGHGHVAHRSFGGNRHYGYGGYRSYGYRPYYSYRNSYYPRYFNYGYYRPYYRYAYYPRAYYYSAPYYYYSPYCYSYYDYPCVGATTFSGIVGSYVVPSTSYTAPPMARAEEDLVVPPTPNPEGTFPYDGGPARPVPMPDVEPRTQPQKAAPIDPSKGRIVSLPARSTKFAYPAYGEKAAPSSFAEDRVILITTDPVKAARR